jgi:hypothetical protein
MQLLSYQQNVLEDIAGFLSLLEKKAKDTGYIVEKSTTPEKLEKTMDFLTTLYISGVRG